MTVLVVDLLEKVDIDHDDAQRAVPAHDAADFPRQRIVEIVPVIQARQGITCGQVAQGGFIGQQLFVLLVDLVKIGPDDMADPQAQQGDESHEGQKALPVERTPGILALEQPDEASDLGQRDHARLQAGEQKRSQQYGKGDIEQGDDVQLFQELAVEQDRGPDGRKAAPDCDKGRQPAAALAVQDEAGRQQDGIDHRDRHVEQATARRTAFEQQNDSQRQQHQEKKQQDRPGQQP